MADFKQLSYSTLRCLLKYLEPNLRFQIAINCPSIRNLEKSIPLRMKLLEITENSIRVNNSIFNLTVTNQHGNHLYDINQTGDLDLSEVEQESNELKIDVRIDPALGELQQLQARRAINYLKLRKHMREHDHDVKLRNEWHYNVSGEITIQLEVGGKYELMNYKRKMHEAMKYLLGKLFGGRSVKVIRFAIGCHTILRIPSKLKFNIKILEILDDNIHANLTTVSILIDDSSLPLTTVKFCIQSDSMNNRFNFNFNHEIIKMARMVEFQSISENRLRSLARHSHMRVHITHTLESECVFRFIEYWVTHGKDIGTYYTFDMSREKIMEVMFIIRDVYDGNVEAGFAMKPNQFTLNLDATSQLVISQVQKENAWILALKVENRRLS